MALALISPLTLAKWHSPMSRLLEEMDAANHSFS